MKDITLLDGSIGQELVKRAGKKPTAMWSTAVLIDQPNLVREVHNDYFSAGASVATTNTYPVLKDRLEREGLADQIETLWARAVETACAARNAHGVGRVAGAIGPLVASYRPELCPPAAEAEALYADIVAALAPNVDVFILETMCSADQAEGLLRATGKTDTPSWLAVSVDDFNGKTLRSGEPLEALKPVLDRHKPDAVLINCARPEAVNEGLEILKDFGLPFGAYANGFTKITDGFLTEAPTVDALQERQDLDPKAYATHAMGWVAQGASIIGGCCEVGPAHIAEIAKQLSQNGYRII